MKKKADDYTGPIAEFTYPDGTYRRLEYPNQPIGLTQKEGLKFVRPETLVFLAPEDGWEEARAAEDRPVNQAYLAQWRERCHEALMKGKK